MSAFTSTWLSLREPADARARNAALIASLSAQRQRGQSWRIVDLGSGTGANLRHLAPLLGSEQRWLLIENDNHLIAHAPAELRAWADRQGYGCGETDEGETLIRGNDFSATVRWQCADLVTDVDALPLQSVDLMTCSAFLDLVSPDWINALAGRCGAYRCAVLFALSYDGQIEWRPALAADYRIRHLLNRHQRGNKGFGPAAGPEAPDIAIRCLRDHGYRLLHAHSPWRLSADDAELQATLARGWARAAKEMDPAACSEIDTWLNQRLSRISRWDSHLTVGHVDLLGLP